MSTVV